ncbi:MAG: hypothetical protein ACLVKO_11390 [Dysgonomonas sp.]
MRFRLFLLIVFSSVLIFNINAQERDEDNYYAGIEAEKDLNLSPEQVKEIKKLNREIGPKFAEIGRDRSLSGYEKGQKKRALALEHKAQIQRVLRKDQMDKWERRHGRLHDGKGIKDNMTDNIDYKLDVLEAKYKRDKKAIENDDRLSKEQKKIEKERLKDSYKAEKERFKNKKKAVKNRY